MPDDHAILALYSEACRILWVSHAVPPYQVSDAIGQLAWFALPDDDAKVCQAAFARTMASRRRQMFDVTVRGVGTWRVWLQYCRIGRVRVAGVSRQIPAAIAALTPRERQVCALLAMGMLSKEVAARLSIRRGTVDNHRLSIAAKVGIHSRALVSWCGRNAVWFDSTRGES